MLRSLTGLLATVAVGSMTFSLRAATLEVGAADSAGSVEAALSRAREGDVIHVGPGTFSLKDGVRVRSGVRFVGSGADQTVLQWAGQQGGPVIRLEGAADVEIASLTIDGRGDPNAVAGIEAHDCRRLNLRDLRIMHLAKGEGTAGPVGIHFRGDDPTRARGVTDSAIVGCTFEDVGVGAEYGAAIRISWGSSRNRVERNRVARTGRGGIFCNDGCADVVIRGNTVRESGGEGLGIEVWNGCDRAVIEDNRVDHWISVDRSDGCAVRRNVVASDPAGAVKANGLELAGSSFAVVTDNLVDGGQQLGISVSGDEPKECVLWAYDRVRHCQTWGAQLQGDKAGVVRHYFYRCAFDDTIGARSGTPLYPDDAGHGLRTNGNVRAVTFEACEFAGNAGAGVQLGGEGLAGLRFVGCVVERNAGPRVDGGAGSAVWADRADGADVPRPGISIPRTGRVGDAVDFEAPNGGGDAKVLWDLGDGPPASTAHARHAYAQPGRYRVTLVTWDAAGKATHCERQIEIAAAP